MNQHGVLGFHAHIVVIEVERGEQDGRRGDVGKGVGRIFCSVDMVHAEIQPNDEILLVERLPVKELIEVDGRFAGKMDVPAERRVCQLEVLRWTAKSGRTTWRKSRARTPCGD